MLVFERYQDLSRPAPPSVVTIGSFDGLHRGHRLLIDRVLERTVDDGLRAAVLTFRPHPAKVLAPRYCPPLLMPHDRKMRALEALGMDLVLAQTFDEQFARLSAEDFVRLVVAEALGAKRVVVGDDFTFGRDRRGVAEDLEEMGGHYGLEVEVIRRLGVEGIPVSSTRIRSFLLQGKVRGASLLLGRLFTLDGDVVTGLGRGRKLGFPTANLRARTEILPARGVYACILWIDGLTGLPAVTNVGTSPTFGPGELAVEVHVLDTQEDFVGRQVAVGFLERLRPEHTFPSPDALVAQMQRDVREARRILEGFDPPARLDPADGINLTDGRIHPDNL